MSIREEKEKALSETADKCIAAADVILAPLGFIRRANHKKSIWDPCRWDIESSRTTASLDLQDRPFEQVKPGEQGQTYRLSLCCDSALNVRRVRVSPGNMDAVKTFLDRVKGAQAANSADDAKRAQREDDARALFTRDYPNLAIQTVHAWGDHRTDVGVVGASGVRLSIRLDGALKFQRIEIDSDRMNDSAPLEKFSAMLRAL